MVLEKVLANRKKPKEAEIKWKKTIRKRFFFKLKLCERARFFDYFIDTAKIGHKQELWKSFERLAPWFFLFGEVPRRSENIPFAVKVN